MTTSDTPTPDLPLVRQQQAFGQGLLAGALVAVAEQSALIDPWWAVPVFAVVAAAVMVPIAWLVMRALKPERHMDDVAQAAAAPTVDRTTAARRSGYRQAFIAVVLIVALQLVFTLARGSSASAGTGALLGVSLVPFVQAARLRKWEEARGRRLWVRQGASWFAVTAAQGRRRLVTVPAPVR